MAEKSLQIAQSGYEHFVGTIIADTNSWAVNGNLVVPSDKLGEEPVYHAGLEAQVKINQNNFVHPITEQEKREQHIQGPTKRENFDTHLMITFRGMDMGTLFNGTFRDGKFIYGQLNSRGFDFFEGPFCDSYDIFTIDDFFTGHSSSLLSTERRDLLFKQLPQEFRAGIREFLEYTKT